MFSKILIGQAANSDKVNNYLNSCTGWKEFETDIYNVRVKEDSMKLGGSTEKKEEEDDEDLNARDENFNSDELLDKEDEKEKFNILPGDEDEEQNVETEDAGETLVSGNEKGKLVFEEVTEEIVNPNIQPEGKVESKVFLDDMKDSDTVPEPIIGKFSNEFAENNYWEPRPDIKLEDLEADYEF